MGIDSLLESNVCFLNSLNGKDARGTVGVCEKINLKAVLFESHFSDFVRETSYENFLYLFTT